MHNEFKVSVSNLTFGTKQETEDCYKTISFTPSTLTLESLTTLVSEGHAFCHNFFTTTPEFKIKSKTLDFFESASIIAVDLDECEYNTLKELTSNINLTPSLSYTTLSHKQPNKGNRYRLLYVFNDTFKSNAEFKYYYNCVINYLKTQINICDDKHMNSVSQMFYGSSSSCAPCAKEVINNNVIYSKSQFTSFAERQVSTTTTKNSSSFTKIENEKVINNEDFITDFNSDMGNLKLIEKYNRSYDFFDKTPLTYTESESKFIMLPENYYEIKRYFITKKNDLGTVTRVPKKLKNGEHRKSILFTNAIIRRLMLPTITFDHLLYCITRELVDNCINSKEDMITREKIYSIVVDANNVDLTQDVVKKIAEKYRVKNKWVVNMLYVTTHNTTKEAVRNEVKKEINYSKIAEYYNTELSVKQNYELLLANNVEVSIRTLYTYKAEMNGVKSYKPKKVSTPKRIVLTDFLDDEFYAKKQRLADANAKAMNKYNWSDEDFIFVDGVVTIKQEPVTIVEPEPEPVTETIVEKEEIINVNKKSIDDEEKLLREYLRITKECSNLTNNFTKKDNMLIINAYKEVEMEFNRLIDKEDITYVFDEIETKCLNIVTERIEQYYKHNEGVDKDTVINYYVPNVLSKYQSDVTNLINKLHTA